MAEDDQDRTREKEAELEAEIDSEMERIGQNPDQVQEGSENLGTQSAASGNPREEATDEAPPDQAATSQEDAREVPDEQQQAQWEGSGGDADLAEEVTAGTEEDDRDGDDEADEETADDERPEWAEGADADLAEDLVDEESPE